MTRDELETQLGRVINDAEWDTIGQVMTLIDQYTDGCCQACDGYYFRRMTQ